MTGRKKELIVTAGGKNVAPAVLEDRIRAHPLVSQCHGGGRRPPVRGLPDHPGSGGRPHLEGPHGNRPADTSLADLTDDPDLIAELQAAVDDANKAVSRAESIRRFRVLDADFTEQAGYLTPSLKAAPQRGHEGLRGQIEALYS